VPFELHLGDLGSFDTGTKEIHSRAFAPAIGLAFPLRDRRHCSMLRFRGFSNITIFIGTILPFAEMMCKKVIY